MANIMNYFSSSYIREKWGHSGFRKYFQNTAWMFGSRILSMGISFLATIYIARNLGPTNYGQLSYAISFVSLFGFIASLGIDGILYRDLIRLPEKRTNLLGTAFAIKFVAGLFTGIMVALFALFFAQDDVSKILIFILAGTFIINPFQIIIFEFQSRADSKYPSIVSLFVGLLLNILKVFIVATGKGVIYLALTLLLESVLYAVLYLFIYEKKTSDSVAAWSFDRHYAKSLLKDSSPLIALSAFSMIYARIDQVFIKHMIDATAVGLYDSAVRLAEVWSFIPSIVISAVYPAIVNAKMTARELYNQRLIKLALFLLVLAVGIALPVSIFSSFIISTLYGSAFLGAIPVLKIYVWANIGTFLGIFVTQYLMTENYRKILFFVALVPMLCNVGLNILWIPIYGIEGAAYATLISYSLAPISILLFKQMRKKIFSVYTVLR